jgi:hypothetical protein
MRRRPPIRAGGCGDRHFKWPSVTSPPPSASLRRRDPSSVGRTSPCARGARKAAESSARMSATLRPAPPPGRSTTETSYSGTSCSSSCARSLRLRYSAGGACEHDRAKGSWVYLRAEASQLRAATSGLSDLPLRPWGILADMRIASLLPSATEIICALGSRAELVGRSHECDFPAGVQDVLVLTSARIEPRVHRGLAGTDRLRRRRRAPE